MTFREVPPLTAAEIRIIQAQQAYDTAKAEYAQVAGESCEAFFAERRRGAGGREEKSATRARLRMLDAKLALEIALNQDEAGGEW